MPATSWCEWMIVGRFVAVSQVGRAGDCVSRGILENRFQGQTAQRGETVSSELAQLDPTPMSRSRNLTFQSPILAVWSL